MGLRVMHIFLSYAGEHRSTADAIALRLRQSGHDVFFDKDDLPTAEGYDERIRRAIERSDLLVFLVSPESVEHGSYCLTELELARDRWKDPSGRVLPVIIVPTPFEAIPEYLKAVTILQPEGNVVAETDAAVRKLTATSSRWKRRALLAIAVPAVAVGAVFVWKALHLRPRDLVTGTVTDLATGSAVSGAAVEVACGVRVIAEGVTDAAGEFELGAPPCRETSTVSIQHELYLEQAEKIRKGEEKHLIGLLPKALGGCVIKNAQGVVVGHFRPPISNGEGGNDLAGRIADGLTYDVLTVLQTLNLPSALQPRFVGCDELSPRSLAFTTGYARALGADALLLGDVEPADGAFRVSALIGDAFDMFEPPFRSTTTGVALNDPTTAKLGPDMRAAILTAVARGLGERGKFAECVEVAAAAERLLGQTTPALAETLERCRNESGLSDLRRGG
jgi:TIR domain